MMVTTRPQYWGFFGDDDHDDSDCRNESCVKRNLRQVTTFTSERYSDIIDAAALVYLGFSLFVVVLLNSAIIASFAWSRK